MLDVAKLTRTAVEAVPEKRRPAAGAWSRRQQNDVSAGRNTGSLPVALRRVSWFLEGAAVRVCQTFSSLS